jgi:predicted Zn-dependent peptidase
MVLAVSGDVRTADIVARLDALLGDWGARTDPRGWPPPSAEPPAPAAGLYVRQRNLPQAKVAMGHRIAARRGWEDPDEAPLMVLAEILGGDGAVSRLRRRLRAQEGLVYRANARLALGQHGAGTFQVFLEAETRRAARALELARAEVLALRDNPVSEDELRLAQRSLTALLPLLFDSAEKRAGRFAEDILLGRPHSYWTGLRRRLEAVTPRDVQAAARRHLRPEELLVVLVGDSSAITADLTRLFGNPHEIR